MNEIHKKLKKKQKYGFIHHPCVDVETSVGNEILHDDTGRRTILASARTENDDYDVSHRLIKQIKLALKMIWLIGTYEVCSLFLSFSLVFSFLQIYVLTSSVYRLLVVFITIFL